MRWLDGLRHETARGFCSGCTGITKTAASSESSCDAVSLQSCAREKLEGFVNWKLENMQLICCKMLNLI